MEVKDILKKQVEENTIVLYMKGTPESPMWILGVGSANVGSLRC